MTTWLDFRTEPIMFGMPEAEIKELFGGKFLVICDDMDCPIDLTAYSKDEAEEEVQKHQDWHREGMPQ